MAKKKKFDTNPLDPDFPAKAAARAGEGSSAATAAGASPTVVEDPHATFTPETQTLAQGDPVTRLFEEPPPTAEQEQATRKFDAANFGQYENPYDGRNVPAGYQPPIFAKPDPTRKVAKVGLPENVLTALPYVPFSIGLIAGIVELFIVPKSEAKVRFHAAQGVAAHVAILAISAILTGFGKIADVASAGSGIFWLVSVIMLSIFAIKAFQGKPIHIEAVDDLTNWLEDKIKPSE